MKDVQQMLRKWRAGVLAVDDVRVLAAETRERAVLEGLVESALTDDDNVVRDTGLRRTPERQRFSDS